MQVFLVVIDSFGIGSAPDADGYGDRGANTAGHILAREGSESWPNLLSMGLGRAMNIACPDHGIPLKESDLIASYACLVPESPGKDTVSGHWELSGIRLEKPFMVFPEKDSFPDELLKPLMETFHCSVLGNHAASGTEIISLLGDQHLETGDPILYTSADSVIQIAAHESVISVENLYEMCRYMRNLSNPLNVGRVIARPFMGRSGAYERTSRRKDFAMKPPKPNLLSQLQQIGVETIGVGKIGDIFNQQGLSHSYADKGNSACLERLQKLWDEPSEKDQFVFVNLVDTDMIYGHRRDVQGYGRAVTEIDAVLGQLMARGTNGQQLIVTADHGCDPTWKGSDHTRECVPFLKWQKNARPAEIGLKRGFGYCANDIFATFSKQVS